MIDFRYHIVSIVAIFFALGAGVVLGAGPLKGTGSEIVASQAERDRQQLADTRQQLTDLKALDKYRDDYVAKVTAGLTDGKLTGKKIVVVTMPAADNDLTNSIQDELEKAGGQVTTKVALDPKLFDAGQRQLVESLVTQLVTADIQFPTDSTAYQRAGTDPGPRGRGQGGRQGRRRRLDQDPRRTDRREAAVAEAVADQGPGQPDRRGGRQAADAGAGQLDVQRRGRLHRGPGPGQRRGRRRRYAGERAERRPDQGLAE